MFHHTLFSSNKNQSLDSVIFLRNGKLITKNYNWIVKSCRSVKVFLSLCIICRKLILKWLFEARPLIMKSQNRRLSLYFRLTENISHISKPKFQSGPLKTDELIEEITFMYALQFQSREQLFKYGILSFVPNNCT